MQSGRVLCWGMLSERYAGHLPQPDSFTPVRAPVNADVVDISVGGLQVCALTRSGGVLCWGENRSGNLGDGWSAGRHWRTASNRHRLFRGGMSDGSWRVSS